MPNLKLQVSRALSVIPSQNTNIPMPNVIVTSTATTTTANKLVDSTKNFSSVGTNPLNIQVGDIVYNTTTSTAAMVIKVDSATQLTLNANIMASTNAYTLYSGTNIPGSIEPCVLYVGTGGDLDITTAGGDVVTFVGIASGTFLPVQVIRVNSVGDSTANIIALW
jgi:hypothetical protein